MFNLIGYRVDHEYGYGGWTGETIDIVEVVATFDTEKDARTYIRNATLKNANYFTERPFRKKSLLCDFKDADVKAIEIPEIPPHNPEL